MNKRITIEEIERYQKKMDKVKSDGFRAKDYKKLGREIVKDYPYLTDRDAINILNGNSDEILEILKKKG